MGRIVNCLSNPSSLVRSHGRKKRGGKAMPFSSFYFTLPSVGLGRGGGEVGEGEAGNKGFLFLFKSTSTQSNV